MFVQSMLNSIGYLYFIFDERTLLIHTTTRKNGSPIADVHTHCATLDTMLLFVLSVYNTLASNTTHRRKWLFEEYYFRKYKNPSNFMHIYLFEYYAKPISTVQIRLNGKKLLCKINIRRRRADWSLRNRNPCNWSFALAFDNAVTM